MGNYFDAHKRLTKLWIAVLKLVIRLHNFQKPKNNSTHLPEELYNELRHKCQCHVTRMQMYRTMFIKWLRIKRNRIIFSKIILEKKIFFETIGHVRKSSEFRTSSSKITIDYLIHKTFVYIKKKIIKRCGLVSATLHICYKKLAFVSALVFNQHRA